jgi:tetratricopeptide (TPR) repeat protein
MKSLLSAARKALDESDFETAIDKCNAVLEQDPNNYNAHVFKGFALNKTEQVPDAIQEFEIAVKLNPSNPLAYQGLIAATQENPSLCISYYKRLLELHMNSPQKYYDDLLKMIDVYQQLNDYASVIEIWEKFLKSSPEYAMLKEQITFTPREVWQNILTTALQKDAFDYEQEWQIQKYRIQHKTMDAVKADIEKDVNLKSRVGEAIENILIKIEKDQSSEYLQLCNQLIMFLYKRLQVTENLAHKEKVSEARSTRAEREC